MDYYLPERPMGWVRFLAILLVLALAFGLITIVRQVGVGRIIEVTPLRWLMPITAEGAVNPQLPKNFTKKVEYEEGSYLEDKIRAAKLEMLQRLFNEGCREAVVSVWREEDIVIISATCQK